MGGIQSAEQVTERLDLSGKTYLVTGVATGLGFESIRVLALRGANVICAARSKTRAEESIAKLPAHKGKLTPVSCDLGNLASVRACISEVIGMNVKLDAIIANAAIMALPKFTSINGIEAQFFTNYLAHFVLVNGLLDTLTEDGRVVLLSSGAINFAPKKDPFGDVKNTKNTYGAWSAYGSSKLAMLLFAKQLSIRLKAQNSKRTANSLHPGVIRTALQRSTPGLNVVLSLFGPLLRGIGQGTATQIYLATSPDVATVSGKFFSDIKDATASLTGIAKNDDGKQLWDLTEELLKDL